MSLAITVGAVVLGVIVATAIVGYLIDRSAEHK